MISVSRSTRLSPLSPRDAGRPRLFWFWGIYLHLCCHVHFIDARCLCTLSVHFICALHLCPSSMHVVCALHLCTSSVHFIYALHLCTFWLIPAGRAFAIGCPSILHARTGTSQRVCRLRHHPPCMRARVPRKELAICDTIHPPPSWRAARCPRKTRSRAPVPRCSCMRERLPL